MLPQILQKFSFPRLSCLPPFKFSTAEKHKITKLFRPLSVSSSAAVRKPTKVVIKKISPFRKLYSKRPNAYIMKLEKHCWESSLMSRVLIQASIVTLTSNSIQVQPKRRKHQKSPRNLNLLKKLKTVAAAGIRKKAGDKIAKQQRKRKLKKRLQVLPSLGMSDNTSITYKVLPDPTVAKSQCTPSTSDVLASPRVFVSRNGKLRGPDSVFATSDFDASEMKAYTIDDPAKYKDSIEAHLEMKMEIARASDPETFDDLARDGWSPETFAGRFIAEVSLHRRKIAQAHALSQERKHEQMQIDPVAPSITSMLGQHSAFAHPPPPPPPQPTHEDKPMLNVYNAMFNSARNVSAPAAVSGAAAHIAQRNTGMPHNFTTYPLKAHPQKFQGMSETAAKKPLAPPPGVRKAIPMNLTTYPLLVSGTPQTSQPTAGAPAVAAKKALAPPPGARRAVPMNLITLA